MKLLQNDLLINTIQCSFNQFNQIVMSREIKFRAWSNAENEMLEVLAIAFDEDMIHFETKEKETDWWNTKHFELMQFTGLYDMNGKEIYEGDIVHCDRGQGFTGLVKYELQAGQYWICEKNKLWDVELCFGSQSRTENEIRLSGIEVIGEIHQNSKLLNNEKDEQ